MESESVFGAEPEQLNELLSVGEDGPNNSAAQDEALPSGRPSEKKSESAPAVDAFVEQPGSWIGPYKLLKVLGEGGMGIAYLAEQKQPMRRQVAIKVIKPGMDSRRVVSRFEAERQALALLDHPNIAHVYDAGTTELGRPYFVMEYVKGLQISDYCDHCKLTIEDRLRLFLQICQAVQHAHQKGIIHRDIKPSNILVSVENDRATPKIIDFGVAKAIGRPLTDRTLFTEDSQLLGTPEYMSPEQVDMVGEDIDTRSDVYSLGVLLYVLLTGVLPFDPQTLRDSGIENIRRTIRQTDPKTPSTRLTKLGEEATAIAQNRRMEIQTLTRHLRRELEWIPLKAMRKERSERYNSASELADDIENYLRGEPLMAGPPTSIYRLKKFVRRNTVLSGAVLAVAVTLILGLAGTTTMYLRAERALDKEANARAEAEGALSRAQAVSDFLAKDILGAEGFSDGQEWDPDYFLDNAAQKLEDEFKDQPLEEARVRHALGQRYLSMGRPEKAVQLMERAYQIRLQDLGPEHKITIGTTNMLCWAYCNLDRHDDAIKLWNEQIGILRKTYGKTGGLGLRFMMNIGQTYVYLGKFKEAEAWLDKTTELGKSVRGQFRDFAVRMARLHQGKNYLNQGRYDEAEQILSKTLEEREGSKDWRTLKFTVILSQVYKAQGRYQEAQQLCQMTVDTMRQELGETHSETLRAKCCLGQILMDQEFFDEVEKLLKEALEGQQRKFGDDHVDTLATVDSLAVLYKEQARYDEAEPLLIEAVKGRRLKLGDEHPHTQESVKNLIELYKAWGKPERIESLKSKMSNS